MTKVKKNMKNQLLSLYDKWLLRKRMIIESVNNLLKNRHQIEHHRHQSLWNFLSNLLSGIAAYCLTPISLDSVVKFNFMLCSVSLNARKRKGYDITS